MSVFDQDLVKPVGYGALLRPSLWRRLPGELVTSIAEALRDLLLKESDSLLDKYSLYRSWLQNLAMVCRSWHRLFSPLQYSALAVTNVPELRNLEELLSSPSSSKLKNYIRRVDLKLLFLRDDESGLCRFFSAWRSLSRDLHQMTQLHIDLQSTDIYLKSSLISLRPCPRPLLHIRNLVLYRVAFPSFATLFRDIGALPSLERLGLCSVRCDGARCDPDSPPSSTAAFSSIKSVWTQHCLNSGWPYTWIFTTSSLRYRRPWRTPDGVEDGPTRSVRGDVRAVVQAVKWMLNSTGEYDPRLEYVDSAPKGA